jgi:hypothetical protein
LLSPDEAVAVTSHRRGDTGYPRLTEYGEEQQLVDDVNRWLRNLPTTGRSLDENNWLSDLP